MGTAGNHEEEQRQLQACLDNPFLDDLNHYSPPIDFPANARSSVLLQLGESYFFQNRADEAVELLLTLKNSKPLLGFFNGKNQDELIKNILNRLSDHYHAAAQSIASNADNLENSAVFEGIRASMYEQATVLYAKSSRAKAAL